MRGETVVVYREVETGVDPLNNPIVETVTETVRDVLVAPGPRNDVDASNRPDGVEVAYNIHLPKSYTADVTGAEISVRGEPPLPVVGAPRAYTTVNTPTRWNRPVELRRVDG